MESIGYSQEINYLTQFATVAELSELIFFLYLQINTL